MSLAFRKQVLQKTDVLGKVQWACLYPSLLNLYKDKSSPMNRKKESP